VVWGTLLSGSGAALTALRCDAGMRKARTYEARVVW
jgi:hypothetical protein